MTLKLAVSSGRPSVPYGANLLLNNVMYSNSLMVCSEHAVTTKAADIKPAEHSMTSLTGLPTLGKSELNFN